MNVNFLDAKHILLIESIRYLEYLEISAQNLDICALISVQRDYTVAVGHR